MRGKFTKDYWIIKWSGLFDPVYYLKQYPDVRRADVDPLEHFVMHGWKEGRNPNEWFNTREYLEKNPDVAKAGINPFVHWIRWGRFEGREPVYFSVNYRKESWLNIAIDLLKKLIKPYLFFRLVNLNNIKKSVHYVRKYGLKSFIYKARQKVDAIDIHVYKDEFDDYTNWILYNEPSIDELIRQKKESFKIFPKISIISATYNTKSEYLKEMIESVMNQTYSNWELCIADGGSREQHVRDILDSYSKKDKRIKIKYLNENKGISGNFNEALRLATGEFITFLDHDDILAPFALYEVVKAINQNPDVDFIYSDEDLITSDSNKRYNPIFKPDWSPDTLRSYNYITHMMVVKKELLENVGYFNSEYDGAQEYDLALRCTERARKIVHIPKILYHWRSHPQSTAMYPEVKKYAHNAGKRALEDHLKRLGIDGWIEDGEDLFCYNVRYKIKHEPFVSIIIPTKDKVELLKDCLESIIQKSTYRNYEIIVLNNRSEEERTYKFFQEISRDDRIRIVNADYDFNWCKLCNHGISEAKGDVFILLNNDTKVITEDWIERLAEKSLQDWVGAVGALLLYEDNTIQHAGVIVGLKGWAEHYYKKFYLYPSHSPFVSPLVCRNVLAVTGACMAVSKKTIEKIGLFDERFIVGGGDVEFCIRAYEKGLFNIYDPSVRLYHLESKSRGSYVADSDFKESERVYKKYWISGDPFYNPNLALDDYVPKVKKNAQCKKFNVPIFNVPEVTPLHIVPSKHNIKRINLLVPSVYKVHAFGGIMTAIYLLKELQKYLEDYTYRIIVTDSIFDSSLEIIDDLKHYKITPLNEDSNDKYQIVFAGCRLDYRLPVTKYDVFIATAWWTAYIAKKILNIQNYLFQKFKPLIYLIQDFEPGFYNWQVRYALAESTYDNNFPIIAIINSKELFDFLNAEGYKFYRKFYFEPVLNPVLKKYINEANRTVRKNQIIIYGRPSVGRNCFEIIVSALKLFCQTEIAKHFSFVSLGEQHDEILLGNNKVLISKGKVSLDEYAQHLLESKIGISIMISPHPSYPPLEMACFGLYVITNKFKTKDLSQKYSNIINVEIDPEDICKKLVRLAYYCMDKDYLSPKFDEFEQFINGSYSFEFICDLIREFQ